MTKSRMKEILYMLVVGGVRLIQVLGGGQLSCDLLIVVTFL
jgi:hypothetical protein